jgi:hypothetical protein
MSKRAAFAGMCGLALVLAHCNPFHHPLVAAVIVGALWLGCEGYKRRTWE